jgi:CTP synthase
MLTRRIWERTSEAPERRGWRFRARRLRVTGIEEKINAINYARRKIPYFGICLGMQLAVIEVMRNLAKLKGAHSTESDEGTPYPVIYLMEEWVDREERFRKGHDLRKRRYHEAERLPVQSKPGSLAHKA